MDYEKKYREALEIAKSLYDQHDVDWKDEDIEAIFPELKESEDEKVRKKIIEHIRWCEDDGNCAKEGSQRWIAWLEKQGEQKSADKVEPKFHNGEWVVNTVGDTNKVVKVWDDGYTLDDNTFLSNSWATEHYHLWTIQDVKDGDVLCYKDEISIYKHNIENCTKQGKTFGGFVYHCCYDGKKFIINSLYSLTEQDKINIHPATKEQRDTLEKAITNAGYRWDKEKLKLEKV